MMKRVKICSWLQDKWLLAVIIVIVGVVIGFSLWISIEGKNEHYAAAVPKLIEVKKGMTTADVANMLHEKGLVKNPFSFRLEARINGLATKIQAGIYQIEGGMSNREIVEVLAKGRIQLVHLIVPEGYNIDKIAQKIEAEGLGKADKFKAAAKNFTPYDYMKTDNPEVIYTAEGFTFPATYEFPMGLSEENILTRMVEQFDREMHSAGILQKSHDKGYKLRDVINLAAMVELETIYTEEQPKIAGVFIKRLALDMPIQSDTTIQYILGKQKELITFEDTKIKNPYNTYQNLGLPPGPIASPGLSAIKAVLEPEETDYLYFVAKKDGHHYFSRTYWEHLQAIEEVG